MHKYVNIMNDWTDFLRSRKEMPSVTNLLRELWGSCATAKGTGGERRKNMADER